MPTRTRAAFLVEDNHPLVVDEVELPDPAPDQVLVKLFAGGICHSQLHRIHGRGETPGAVPAMLGHEGTGVVEAKGRDVTHVKEGDNVMTSWVRRSPQAAPTPSSQADIRWRDQHIRASAATWAEHLVATEQLVTPLDSDLPTDVTAIVGCAVMTGAGSVVNTLRVRPGESVAVFGAGGVGLCSIVAAAVVDAYPIIAVDLSDDKLTLARKCGATHTVNASGQDPVEAIVSLTGGGVDYAIDAIGATVTQRQIMLVTRNGVTGLTRGGTSLLAGIPHDEGEPALDTRLLKSKTYMRSTGGDSSPDRDYPIFLRWYRDGKLPLDDIVTRRYRLDEINDAVDDLGGGRIAGRAIIDYSA